MSTLIPGTSSLHHLRMPPPKANHHSTPFHTANPDLPSAALQFKEIQSFAEAATMREEWDALVERVGGDLFASFDWCATWWKHFGKGRRLFIQLAFSGDRLVAVLPFIKETLWWGPAPLRVMRLAGSDHVGTRSFFCAETAFLELVVQHLVRRFPLGTFDLMHIGELPGYCNDGAALAGAFRDAYGEKTVVHVEGHYPHSVFDVPGTLDDYIGTLSQSERSNIRKSYRRFQQEGALSFEQVAPDMFDAGFSEFLCQHDEKWKKEGRLGYFHDWPGAEAFHREFSQKQAAINRLHLIRLRTGNQTIGYHYAHAFAQRMHWFQASRDEHKKWDPYSPGRLLHCELVRSAASRGITQIDGLSGYYEFKRRLGAQFIGLQNIYIQSPGAISTRKVALFHAITKVAAKVYFQGWFWRIAPWIRLRMPHLAVICFKQGLWKRFVRARFILPLRHPAGETGNEWSGGLSAAPGTTVLAHQENSE